MSRVFLRFAVILLLSFALVCGENETKRYAVVTNPVGAMVRSSIEPGANRVGPRNVLRGQRLEILGYEGRLWVKVMTRDGEGYVALSDVEIVEGRLNASPVSTIVLLLVLLGAVGGAVYVFVTKKGLIGKAKDDDEDAL